MDPKLLLVKIITLLFCESKLGDRTISSNSLCKEAIGTIRQAETTLDTDNGREVLNQLKSTALWMCGNPATYVYDKVSFFQRIRMNTGDDESLLQAIEKGISIDDADTDNLKRLVNNTSREIRAYFNQIKIKEILTQAYREVTYKQDRINWDDFVHTYVEKLEPYKSDGSGATNEMIDELDFDNPEAGVALFQRAKDELSSEGIMTFGRQGFNRMWGPNRGIRRGEFLLIGALPYNYKSGICLDIARHICMYNKPYMRDPTKKPLVLFVSFENGVTMNLKLLYQAMYEIETGQKIKVEDIVPREAFDYVKSRMECNGYKFKMLHFDPTEVTYQDLQDLVIKYELEGYEIHAIVCDYLNMMSKRGCDNTGAQGGAIRDLFRRTRNFMAKRGIAFITPHQLSPDAKKLVRGGLAEDFVKEVASKGYYDDCTKIDQEVDIEIVIHIVKVNGVSYLTLQRGKHRGVVTPEKDLFVVYRFHEVGGLRDDINGPDTSLRVVGGDPVSEGGGAPFWG